MLSRLLGSVYLGLAVLPAIAPAKGAPPAPEVPVESIEQETDPFWRNATIYFMMTDRFANGKPGNDNAYGRQQDGDTLRSFMGGDLAGIIEKLESGYFNDLGVTAIWTTPIVEQVHQPFEEYGRSYAFHGYWIRDWTSVDEAYGSEQEFARLVELAHAKGIRVVVDVVLNHAGPPIGARDPAWPVDWVRTEPRCDFKSFAGVATCLIVPALQDIRTESDEPVELPPHLIAKWKAEGRLDRELAELDAFFERTGYPRAPKYYIIKWATDWVREYGVDAFRVDTAKHVDPEMSALLRKEADIAFAEWKANNSAQVLDDRQFYMFGEVFNFGAGGFQAAVAGTREFDYGDIRVDFFDFGYDGLINMGFPTHARLPARDLFQFYADQFSGPLRGVSLINYISTHDDQQPLDPKREKPFENATKLMLSPGSVQIYYGDELNRILVVEGATGDATLRSFMNWDAAETTEGQSILRHWQLLGKFRQDHPAIGAGKHIEHSWSPYVFSRSLGTGSGGDQVLVALSDEPVKMISTYGVFSDGTRVRDSYHGDETTVESGTITFSTERTISLIERVE